jgi:opacity protein-like surface antigen
VTRQKGTLWASSLVATAALWASLWAHPAHAQTGSRATTPAGKALVLVFRSDREPQPGALPVTVNTAKAGNLANGTYVAATVDPGKTLVRIGDRVVKTYSFIAVANQRYFIAVQAVPGAKPLRGEARFVSEAAGQSAIGKSRFVGVGAAPILAAPPPAAAPPPQPPAPAARPAPAKPAPAVSARPPASSLEPSWELALIAKAGAFKMANDSQVVGGLPSTYDTSSKPAAALEVEWRSRSGPAAGFELFYYKNDVSANGTGLTGHQTVIAYLLNGKYYFRATDRLYPFLGAGVGITSASYSGALDGKASGFAYQGLAGIEFRFEHVGVSLQYKYLASTTDDGAGEKVKVGGNGIFAGLSVAF